MTQRPKSEDKSIHHSAPWHDHPPPWVAHGPAWHHKRRLIFRRFLRILIFIGLLFFGGSAVVSLIVTRFFGADGNTAAQIWLGICGLMMIVPILAMGLGMRAWRGIATPIANVMVAADAVADGNLSVRVPEEGPGEFTRLAHSFNRMTAELARSDEQRRNLTADVAHELRTPLHVIQGNLEGVLDGVYEPTVEHIQATLDETRALARLVDDLHILSLAEGGQLPLLREPVNVTELLADLETSFGGQAAAAGITLTVDANQLAPALMIPGDAGRLDQVLSNLLVNAIRHTPAGGTITLQAKPTGPQIRFTVCDTGEGIAPADLPFIFDRFWRGDRARTHAGGVGGGLGLAIARQLVQAHKGSISVESTPGQGTTFIIELPTQ